MSAKNDHQLRNVCLSVFLSAWKTGLKPDEITRNIYIYIYIKNILIFVEKSSVTELLEERE